MESERVRYQTATPLPDKDLMRIEATVDEARYSGRTDYEGKEMALGYARQKVMESMGMVEAIPMDPEVRDALLVKLDLAASTCTMGLFSDEREARRDHMGRLKDLKASGKAEYRRTVERAALGKAARRG